MSRVAKFGYGGEHESCLSAASPKAARTAAATERTVRLVALSSYHAPANSRRRRVGPGNSQLELPGAVDDGSFDSRRPPSEARALV